jgi:hypothetical protein
LRPRRSAFMDTSELARSDPQKSGGRLRVMETLLWKKKENEEPARCPISSCIYLVILPFSPDIVKIVPSGF